MDDFSEREQKAIEDLKEKSEAVARLEAKVVELKRNEAFAKKKGVEEMTFKRP